MSKLPHEIFANASARLDEMVSEMRSRRAACAVSGEFAEAEGFDELRCYCQYVASRLELRDVDSLGMASVLLTTSVTEPKDYADAMTRLDAAEWMQATEEEWGAWKRKEVFDWVDPPRGANVIESKLVYRLKLDEFNLPV
jgi:hypothetical protein